MEENRGNSAAALQCHPELLLESLLSGGCLLLPLKIYSDDGTRRIGGKSMNSAPSQHHVLESKQQLAAGKQCG
jgi:hypothetical protein